MRTRPAPVVALSTAALLLNLLASGLSCSEPVETNPGTGGAGAGGEASGGQSSTQVGGTSTGGAIIECFGDRSVRCDDGRAVHVPPYINVSDIRDCDGVWYDCLLGCRIDGDKAPGPLPLGSLCEEGSIRVEGFPCSADIDCVSPVGATVESNLSDHLAAGGLGGQGGSTAAADYLGCDAAGTCRGVDGPIQYTDIGHPCSAAVGDPRSPSVAHDLSCGSGACLLPPGSDTGVCTSSCDTDADCPPSFECAAVTDNRYQWPDLVGPLHERSPPQLLACTLR